MSLRDAFAGIKAAQTVGESAPEESEREKPAAVIPVIRSQVGRPPLIETTGKLSKSTDPNYKAVKVLLDKKVWRDASRKWEDQERGDFSDLVQELLEEFLRA